MHNSLNAANRVAVAGALSVVLGCGSGARSPALKPEAVVIPMDPVTIDASYGTLSFRGRIDRSDHGTEFEYQPHIDVTFHPNAGVNKTALVDLREYRFSASVPGTDNNGPWKMLYQDSSPISVHLTHDSETAHLPEVRFHLAKTIAAQAQRVGLAVDDGHLLWPIPGNLK